MGFRIVVETEDGTQVDSVEDPENLLHRILPTSESKEYRWAPTIDWYGDTTFNYLQVEKLLVEWERLTLAYTNPAYQSLLRQVDRLLRHCTQERHLYLKFIGD